MIRCRPGDSFEETNKQTLLLLLLLFPMMSGIYYFPCFSNPNTGQKFYERKDLDQYLAFSRKYKLPRECKWETPDVGSSSRSIDCQAKTKSKSKGKNRTKGKGIAKAKSKEKGITKAKLKPKGDIAKAKSEARASGHS